MCSTCQWVVNLNTSTREATNIPVMFVYIFDVSFGKNQFNMSLTLDIIPVNFQLIVMIVRFRD